MFKEEGGNLFDARSASLGHTLQGGVPSPIDRARAVRLSLKCLKFIEDHTEKIYQGSKRHAPPESAAVIAIQGSNIRWVPVAEMAKHADIKKRRGTEVWWSHIKSLVEQLAGKPQFLGVKPSEVGLAETAGVVL